MVILCNSYTMGVTSGAGTAYPYVASEFNTVIVGLVLLNLKISLLLFCVDHCFSCDLFRLAIDFSMSLNVGFLISLLISSSFSSLICHLNEDELHYL
jgi:hypothetical protein